MQAGEKETSWWSDPDSWDQFYLQELIADPEQIAGGVSTRNFRFFDEATQDRLWYADTRLLVAGTGTSPLAAFLACLGFQVTAIDISQVAIQFSKSRYTCNSELNFLIPPNRVPINQLEFWYGLRVKFGRKMKKGGSLKFLCADWNDSSLGTDVFDLIFCPQCFRGANDFETKETAQSLFRLLKPGGLVLASHINALLRENEIVEAFIDAGFEISNPPFPQKMDWTKGSSQGLKTARMTWWTG